MDEASQPLSSAGGNSARHNYRQGPGGMPGGVNGPFNIQNEISFIKEDAIRVHNAVLLLEAEKESLRKAIRKLKVGLIMKCFCKKDLLKNNLFII